MAMGHGRSSPRNTTVESMGSMASLDSMASIDSIDPINSMPPMDSAMIYTTSWKRHSMVSKDSMQSMHSHRPRPRHVAPTKVTTLYQEKKSVEKDRAPPPSLFPLSKFVKLNKGKSKKECATLLFRIVTCQ